MTTNDEHVERATTFNGSEAPHDERLDGSESLHEHYQRLSAANSLRWNGKWRDERQETVKNATAILEATASQLELTPYQKEEAARRLGNLPMKINQAYATSLIALCICGGVGAEDGRNYGPNAANPDIDTDAPFQFKELISDTGVSHAEFSKCWSRIKTEVGN